MFIICFMENTLDFVLGSVKIMFLKAEDIGFYFGDNIADFLVLSAVLIQSHAIDILSVDSDDMIVGFIGEWISPAVILSQIVHCDCNWLLI